MLPPMFIGENRGKRSVAADLKRPETIEVRRMIARFEVLLTNYRPEVLDRLGLGWVQVHNINTRLV